MATFTTVELPSTSATLSAQFLSSVFGFGSTAYGPNYVEVDCGNGVSIGVQSDPADAPAAPLAVIEVDDLEATRAAILAAGGTITLDELVFPGGRRCHFTEPGGNELAAWVRDPAD